MSDLLDIKPVNVPKAADVLAGILREKILGGVLGEGADLPNERDLGVQSGLSRASVREALRILEGEGLISTRTGRNGGVWASTRFHRSHQARKERHRCWTQLFAVDTQPPSHPADRSR